MKRAQGVELTYCQLHKYCNKPVCAVFGSLYVYVCLQHRLISASVSNLTNCKNREFFVWHVPQMKPACSSNCSDVNF